MEEPLEKVDSTLQYTSKNDVNKIYQEAVVSHLRVLFSMEIQSVSLPISLIFIYGVLHIFITTNAVFMPFLS